MQQEHNDAQIFSELKPSFKPELSTTSYFLYQDTGLYKFLQTKFWAVPGKYPKKDRPDAGSVFFTCM
ncbi:hypothetical protein, partial [Alicyclobacillus fodiniaquatilis]